MRVLFIEDDLILAKILVIAMQQDGYIVDHVSNGREGYEKALLETYDIIVLDLDLPKKA